MRMNLLLNGCRGTERYSPLLRAYQNVRFWRRRASILVLCTLAPTAIYFINMEFVHKHLLCNRLGGTRDSIASAELRTWSRQTYGMVLPSFDNIRFFYNMTHEDLGRWECCPSRDGELFYALSADPIGSPSRHDPEGVYVYHPPPHSAYPNHSWVEVTRCMNAKIRSWEDLGAWYYAMPGSGIFLNIGRSIVIPHDSIRGKDSLYYDYGALFDTVQILDNPDQRCGNMAVEIVSLHASGQQLCADEYRSGYNASHTCLCVDIGRCITCARSGARQDA